MPVACRSRPCRRGRSSSIDVSLVVRLRPCRAAHSRTSASARGTRRSPPVPMVTRRQSSRRGHAEQSRTRMLRSSKPCHTGRPGVGCGRNRMKFAPLGNTSTASGRALADPLALGDDQLDPLLHLVDVAAAPAGRRSAWRRRGGTAGRPCPARRPARTARRGSRGELAAIDHVLENVRVTTSGGRLVDQVERRPLGELAVRLVDDRRAPGRCPARRARWPPAPPAPSGCSASTGT